MTDQNLPGAAITWDDKKKEAEIKKINAEIENMNRNRRLEGLKIFLLAVGALGAMISYLIAHKTDISNIPSGVGKHLVIMLGIAAAGIYILIAYVSEGKKDQHDTLINGWKILAGIVIFAVIFSIFYVEYRYIVSFF